MQDGITTEFGIDEKMWCCKTTEDPCIAKGDNGMICNGTASSLSDQCHDENDEIPSCNYYPLSVERYKVGGDFRSYLDLCQDNRYVEHCKAGSVKMFITIISIP